MAIEGGEKLDRQFGSGMASRLAGRSILLVSLMVLSGFFCISLAAYAQHGLRRLSDANEANFLIWDKVVDNCKFLGSHARGEQLPSHVLRTVVDALSADAALINQTEDSVVQLMKGLDVGLFLWFAATSAEVAAVRSADVAPDVKAYLRNLTTVPLEILPAVVSGLDVITSIKIESRKALAPLVGRRGALQNLLSRGTSIIWFLASAMSIIMLLGISAIWIFLLEPPLSQIDDMLAKLKQSEQQLKTTLASIGDAVISTDAKLNIVSMNPVAEALTGWSLAAARGASLNDVVKLKVQQGDTVHPKLMVADKLTILDAAPVGSHWLISRNGIRFRITESVAPLKSDDSDLQGIVIVLRDITKQFELQRQLDSRIKLQAMGELSSGIAHDFNNFLGIIIGTSSLALRRDEAKPVKEQFEAILKVARTGASLTEKLLSFARSSPSSPTMEPIHDVLRDVARKAQELEGPAFQLSFTCRPELVAEVDRPRLEEALLHIVASALEAISEGGHVRMYAYDEVQGDKCFLTVCVEDDGRVADVQRSPPLFEEFFAKRSASRFKGLGIPMAAAFAEQAGGELRIVSNASERRTAVFIRFPISVSQQNIG